MSPPAEPGTIADSDQQSNASADEPQHFSGFGVAETAFVIAGAKATPPPQQPPLGADEIPAVPAIDDMLTAADACVPSRHSSHNAATASTAAASTAPISPTAPTTAAATAVAAAAAAAAVTAALAAAANAQCPTTAAASAASAAIVAAARPPVGADVAAAATMAAAAAAAVAAATQQHAHNLELLTCEDYFRDLLYRVEVTFVDKTVPTDAGFVLELSQRMTYDQMSVAVGQKINCAPNRIQFFKCQK